MSAQELDGPGTLNLAPVTLAQYVRTTTQRIRSGDTGAMPVVAGIVVLAVIFQIANSNFLRAGNLVNLIVQGAVYMLLALGMTIVLLLGEIDLSIGFVSGIGGVTVASLLQHGNVSWWMAVGAAVLATTAIGALQGLIISVVRLPSFVVTLGGMLAWNGVMLMALGNGGGIPINNSTVTSVANGLLPSAVGITVVAAAVVAYALSIVLAAREARSHGNESDPTALVVIKIVAAVAAAIAFLAICNVNRGTLVEVRGVPVVTVIVLVAVAVWSVVLRRSHFGAHLYAVGGSAEAARRAGIAVGRVKVLAFTFASMMGGVAGVVYASRLRSVSTNLDGGTLVLYGIAAAVIGGTSLFGGHGRAVNAVLGGLVIATIDNGMGLLGLSAAARLVVTGVVLVIAVSVDAISRRGRAASGLS